jgi:rod shape-determining protein MreC
VSLRDGPLGEIKPPLIWLAGAALIVAMGLALALFVTDGPHGRAYDGLRRTGDSLTGPVGGVIAAPIRWSGDVIGDIQAYWQAGAQNRQLRADLAAAMSWKDEAVALRHENERLRALAGIATVPAMPMVSADTVLDARGPFSNSRLADAGSDRGVTEGNPVLSEHGLVGRIAGVGAHVSRIMLLTDVESRTPVMIVRTNGRAILAGDGGPDPTLAYLRTHDALRQGDRVMTSGDGGVVPRGLPVGTAVRGFDGAWRVALDADASSIDFVRILLFKDFSQLASPAELAPRDLPVTNTEAPQEPPTAVSPPTTAPPAAKAKSP